MESIILRHIITQLSVNTQGKIKRLNINKMKTEPTINIQDEVSKIHAQYGITEMANYRIEKLFEKHVEQFSPKFKRLEWERNGTIWHVNQYNPVGYQAAITKWAFGEKQYSVRLGLNDSRGIKIFNSLEEAKDFVQKDFEARIKECLIIE